MKAPPRSSETAGGGSAADLVGALTALGIYLDAAERLAGDPERADKLAGALAAAKQQLATAAGLVLGAKGQP